MATGPPAPFGSQWGGNGTAKQQVKNRFQWSEEWGAPNRFHVGGVGEIQPHVIRHLRQAHAKAGRDKRVAALAPTHAGRPPDSQHDLVFARLEHARRHHDLKRARQLVVPDFAGVDEHLSAVGDAVPTQHRQAAGLSSRHAEGSPRPNDLGLIDRVPAPLHERAGQLDRLPRQFRLAGRGFSRLAAVAHNELPRAVQEDRVGASPFRPAAQRSQAGQV